MASDVVGMLMRVIKYAAPEILIKTEKNVFLG